MIFVLILAFLNLGSAQIIQQGQCDSDIQLATNFNVTEFYGRWYVISRTSSSLTNGECSYFEFESENGGISVYKRSLKNNFLEELSGTATLQAGTAKLSLTTAASTQPTDFWILLTDPDYYALAYSCENIGTTQRSLTIWQLGRETTFEYNLMIALMNVTLNNLLDVTLEDLTELDHSEMACAVLPEIPEGEYVVLPGQCDPSVKVVEDFDVERFTGVWHEIASYYSPNALGSCPRAEYTLSGGVVNVVNSQVVNQTLDTISGTATLASTDGSGRLTVRLEVAPGFFAESSLLILATDYEDYAVSYECVDLPDNQKQVTSWILSRKRQLSSNATAAVAQVINSQLDLNTQFYIPADQSDEACFYFPDPVPNQPVTFRGQCDESIPAMQDFDPERYMGKWHDIESYPSEFQDGTCNNAEYTLVDGEVEVFNTQVIDQRLDTLRGVARLASTDGSAKLIVTFPIAGTNFTINTNYWVLSTDYLTYALVYTCENINDDERRVWSWKLSRSKQLTNDAVNKINEVISTIPVLDQRYYEAKDQSVEGCFYFPEPQPGVPVVFPGQCDENVTVVSNFNLGEFTGLWYEVQAYPKVQQTGQCISHAMISSMNVLNLQSSSVTDQQLQVTTGTISFASTDGSAKLVIIINNSTIQIPFWILRTDYSSYALAYACENVGDDFRRIYSWKLSRETVLNNNAITEINNTMADIVVLDNEYFVEIDHSDKACFALPDIPAGEPFIIDGQCDTTIQGISNFDAERYLGRWRLIESYASDFQTGTCSDATYSLGSGNSVVVVNSEVVDQNLETITGSAIVSSTDNSGKLLVSFPGAPEPIEYIILDTDYSNYSLVYSCSNINNQQRRIWSWKMSRSRELSDIAIENINRVIDDIDVLNNRFYETIDQSDEGCFYYPIHEPNTPVIFRGNCDPNVPVVTDFKAGDYMGVWYDIASYPSISQDGTCNTAEYTLVGDTVDVYNTQVINETLDTINGIARLASIDGSAKLIVTFPIPGTNLSNDADYWVLATDYNSYALVYTCIDLEDGESRMVWSWKLSRTKQLTTTAINEINQAISAVPVLDNRYYNDRDHSDEGCFYYPEPENGVPVVFPGLCDSNVQAIPNFNMDGFTGEWFEIEAYPKEFQPGQCVKHEYTTGTANTLNLVSSNVNNETLGISSSILRFASAQDTSGRLEIVTVSNGAETVMPFWIIDTDYSRYALAYSCINDAINNRRTVYSWKLSRSKELSTIDSTFINTAMSNIQVLDNKYFESINQSDDACFYLPVHVPGQPVTFPGQCDENIAVVSNFNASAYLQRWRLIESYPTQFQDGDCIDATYTLNENGFIDVYNTQVINQQLDTIMGNATFAVDASTGKLLVYFPDVPVPAEYWVLDTDYDSFALVYSCFNLNSEQRRVTSWKMSRSAQLSLEAEERITKVMERIPVLNSRYFEPVDQSDAGCFYYPEPTGQPVVFRGRCDPNVNVVTDFDAQEYMGLWYDVSSYPSVFQSGTCNTAEYTLVGDMVDVFNTQVINETLDTINGVARLASTDGSAKLVVTFPIVGTNFTTDADYWVLATDYNSYALVYTCIDFPEDESRLVWSWKLSRTKQLTTNAINEINQAINAVQVLDNRYYIDTDHSDEGCFYYPEPEQGIPVVFPGLCDSTIQAMPSFNMGSFIGDWYEIEAYPKEFQPGQCVNHEYTSGTGNTLNLVSSNVNNQTLGTSSSTLRFASAQDTSGRLELVTMSNGVETVIPFWIIDTDYSRYALAYSCVNDVANNRRTVYSWKLSRSKGLSTIDNTFINTAMNSIQVLDNRYFETIDQSDDACFYLPEYIPGQIVTFPGQCDQNIRVVQNFNASAYQGRWRMIESYPSEFQIGDCSDATYTINAEGSVDVYNTQVINQRLDTINGNAVLATTDGSGKLLVTFPGAPVASEYWILDTDYDNFALVYSCSNVNSEERRVWSWKLSRTTSLSNESLAAISEVVDSINVLNDRYYENIDHSDNACFYYPIPDGNPVTFRGQCDESIAVVQDFDAEAYMGKWYDLQSYPVAFQDGTCPTATYSLTADGVSVYNTQVLAQELDFINGLAQLASTDGSAKLLVTFPIPGTDIMTPPSPYWVLDTDYTNFSLVYSCVNIDEEHRRVSSWKLSRQWNLTQEAENAINAAIARVPVLSQDYYVTRGHDEESCFYYPDNEGGPVILSGICDIDNINIVPNFNVNAFSGSWYEVERYPSELQSGECVANTYEVSGTNTFDVTMTIVENERTVVVSGPATVSSDNQGILDVNLSNGAGVNFAMTMYVVDVEYDDFALLYACSDVGNDSRQLYSWKLSRLQNGLSIDANSRIDAIVNNTVDLFNGYYVDTDQSLNGCFYYPEYEGEPSIDLLGPCDETIRAKQNFEVAKYLGEWYEIESYPQAFQDGECARAQYTLGDNVVDVLNTQVVNRTLDVMTGTAVVASSDGSGLLSVTFELANGVVNVANYYVLETDYDTFALVYSCRNLDNGNRQVTSWKLSRGPTLSYEAEEIMKPIIESTQGLLQEYYQLTSQTEDACFYIPEVNTNEAPVFRGQCEDISGIDGFDPQKYVGWWHEIERYPVDGDVGECISFDFRAAGNQYQVIDTSVFDLVAESNTSSVTVSNNGILTKTHSNGRVEYIWVLATDYETYSLLYSCENIPDSQYMRVWSAKHSKARSLSQAAQDAMAPVIAANRVLEPQFYLAVDQSDDACFHYPEQSGDQVILPGQCDENIPVQQEFDPAQYTGTWYQIERYPQIHESGSCAGARYTLDESTGVVTVQNWQVIEGALDSVTGTATVNSTDGSAKLIVSLPIRDGDDEENPTMISTWLYVLETNYLSYSVAYSCVNVGDFHRAVGVWKLSRTRNMLEADVSTINALISRRPELHQPYFIQVDQNEDCDEPSSAVTVYNSIIVLLLCVIVHALR